MDNNLEKCFDWEDEIQHDSSGWVLLPEGDYGFKVTGFERAHHGGSKNLPPCKKAVLTIEIDAPEGTAEIRHNLFLHSKCEGMLCQFFTAIGQRKHGEPLRMNWPAVVGATGRCKVGIRSWTGDDGKERQSNEIKRFHEPGVTTYEPVEAPRFTPGAF